MARTNEQQREYYATHKQQFRERARRWAIANPEKIREYQRRYRAKHPYNYPRCRHGEFGQRYGFTIEQIFGEAAVQQGCCAICGRDDQVLHIDHNHATGALRGLLCRGCNIGLGNFQEQPHALRQAAAYLERTCLIKS